MVNQSRLGASERAIYFRLEISTTEGEFDSCRDEIAGLFCKLQPRPVIAIV
jgi:hypothetical protein